MVAIPPTRPPTTANPAPEQQRSTPHTPRHAHTQPRHRSIRRRHRDSATPTGDFTTIDTPPRRVAGVSHPYGRNSPHTPTHNHQPCPRATTQHPAHPAPRPYTTSPPQHSQTPPRLGHTNGGFYYHRHPTTACRRRVTPLWSQFPPHTHPQPPTLPPSNNAAPRTPRATPIHNLTTAAFADATSTPPAPTGGFTTIDASPRRVAGVSRPYGRNSPHT